VILFYVDESGTGFRDTGNSPFFVMAAFAIAASDAPTVDARVADLKRGLVHWAAPEDVEIKGRDIRRGDKLFKRLDWQARLGFMDAISSMVAALPCQVFAVQIDKRHLPDSIGSEEHLYRFTFRRLLAEIDTEPARIELPGMLMLDARSDLHSSVQDRRVVDAFRQWRNEHPTSRLLDVPWFGFSEFYAGLQLADFLAYVIDFGNNEGVVRGVAEERAWQIRQVYAKMRDVIHLAHVP
jgi:hypothetical protein